MAPRFWKWDPKLRELAEIRTEWQELARNGKNLPRKSNGTRDGKWDPFQGVVLTQRLDSVRV